MTIRRRTRKWSPIAAAGVSFAMLAAVSGFGAGTASADTMSYDAAVSAATPVAWYQMQESPGTATLKDSSGNSYNGTYSSSGVTLGVPGAIKNAGGTTDHAAAFNGTTGDAAVSVSGRPDLLLNGSFTISFWAKLNAAPPSTAGVSTYPSLIGEGSLTTGYLIWYDASGHLHFVRDQGQPLRAITTAAPLSTSTFNNYVLTYNSSTGVTQWYENGVKDTGATASMTYKFTSNTNATPLDLATSPNNDYANAALDQVAFYNSALPSSTIAAQYQAAQAPPPAPSGVSATPGNASAMVSWHAVSATPAVTSYTVIPYVNGTPDTSLEKTVSAPTTSATVTGLSNGVSYTFEVTATSASGTSPTSSPSAAVMPESTAVPQGYDLVASDGGIFSFGSAHFHGSTGNIVLNKPVVGMASTPHGNGYWLVASDGGIFSFGSAHFYGSMGGTPLNTPIVGMASTPGGHGYWLVAADGKVFAFGSAKLYGSLAGVALNKPIVGMASTPHGHGYWLVAADGGIFSFGSAIFHGSTGNIVLNKPIVGMASTPHGHGYWLVASDGGVFSFGSAAFHGSMGGIALNKPVVGMASTPGGHGYWLVAADGGIFSFGSASFQGSMGGIALNKPVVGMSGM